MTKSDIIEKHKSMQKDLHMLLEKPKDVDLLIDTNAPTDVSPHDKFQFVHFVFVPASCNFYKQFDIAYQRPPYIELDVASDDVHNVMVTKHFDTFKAQRDCCLKFMCKDLHNRVMVAPQPLATQL